jgi:hypothetical protein
MNFVQQTPGRSRWNRLSTWACAASGFLGIVFVGLQIHDLLLDPYMPLRFHCEIPAELPADSTWSDKQGMPHPRVTKVSYPPAYETGWRECLIWTLCEPFGGFEQIDPLNEAERPGLKQFDMATLDAINDGFQDCRRQLAELFRRYPAWSVRRVLRARYGQEWSIIDKNLHRHFPEMSERVR